MQLRHLQQTRPSKRHQRSRSWTFWLLSWAPAQAVKSQVLVVAPVEPEAWTLLAVRWVVQRATQWVGQPQAREVAWELIYLL